MPWVSTSCLLRFLSWCCRYGALGIGIGGLSGGEREKKEGEDRGRGVTHFITQGRAPIKAESCEHEHWDTPALTGLSPGHS